MDFAPEPSSGGGYYERYVSESESTDGEGDASGGGVAATVQRNNGNRQQIRTQRRLDKTATDDYHDFATIQGCGVHFAGDPSVSFKRSGSSSSSSSTIFSKLAASWSIGVSSSKNSDDRHSKNRGEIGGDKSNGWKQGQGGKSTHYSGGLDEGDNGRRAQSLRCVDFCHIASLVQLSCVVILARYRAASWLHKVCVAESDRTLLVLFLTICTHGFSLPIMTLFPSG